jgi:fibronectin type 3 domain-containing protein
MRRFFTLCTIWICVNFSAAQQIQGNVTLGGRATMTAAGHSVLLSWNTSLNATSYNIYRGTTHGGPYQQVATGIVVTSYSDLQVLHGQMLFYVATAVTPTGESGFSNETVATIP